MALIDRWDWRALRLAAVPLVVFLVLLARCFFPPFLGWDAALPFAGVLLLFYGPVFYLALCRGWGGPVPWRSDDRREHEIWPQTSRPLLGGIWPGAVLVLFTLWVAHWHWGLISSAREELERIHALRERLAGGLWDAEPTGLDLFGEALPVVGIVMPLIVVGILWFLLPRRP